MGQSNDKSKDFSSQLKDSKDKSNQLKKPINGDYVFEEYKYMSIKELIILNLESIYFQIKYHNSAPDYSKNSKNS